MDSISVRRFIRVNNSAIESYTTFVLKLRLLDLDYCKGFDKNTINLKKELYEEEASNESGKTMKLLLGLLFVFSLTSLLLGFEYPKIRDGLLKRLFLFRSGRNSTQHQHGRTRRYDIHMGKTGLFCDMLNCPCVRPSPSARCCEGYLYDERSKECRYVYTDLTR
ncbi:hypothetical protein NPIL_536791 [Nephila pilipes]|uniref:Uncharacterized protein n=1 Tax=Nephila pilipes TaxID=299642 RepID=A0A8X6MVV5_NEPPI|nr:hypothetical protein NPIL_536791 [Nephila pilipes]